MNKVHNINLGGYAFTIDEDAYASLKRYLKSIRNHFSSSEGYEDIMSDIELRLAELFREHMQNREIVTMKEVRTAIDIMGTPEDFGIADPQAETGHEDREKQNEKRSAGEDIPKYKTGKRLFRDPDNKIFGGVCAGISAYFGISDPIWLRILFIILFLSGGSGILVYLILWLIMPVAQTAKERLSMRGEPINVDNIARTVEKEIDDLSERFTSGKKK